MRGGREGWKPGLKGIVMWCCERTRRAGVGRVVDALGGGFGPHAVEIGGSLRGGNRTWGGSGSGVGRVQGDGLVALKTCVSS